MCIITIVPHVILRQFIIRCHSSGRKIQELEKELDEKHLLVINKEKNDEKVKTVVQHVMCIYSVHQLTYHISLLLEA